MVRVLNAIFRRLAAILRWIYYSITIFAATRLPPSTTRFGGRFRVSHLPLRLSMGQDCHFGDEVFFGTAGAARIDIGNAVSFNNGTHVIAYERITIGSNTAIGEYVSIRDQAHTMESGVGPRNNKFKVLPIEIGRNCWIGRGAFIGAGTQIGENCIVGANSVVHGSFPDNVLIAGAPAKIRKEIVPL